MLEISKYTNNHGEERDENGPTYKIAIALTDKYPETDPRRIRFTDQHGWVFGLEGFNDDPDRSGESDFDD